MAATEEVGSFLVEDWHGGYSLHKADVRFLPILKLFFARCSDCDFQGDATEHKLTVYFGRDL